MIVLGLHGGHDASACLLKDGEIVTMVEEERLNRNKHSHPAPWSHHVLSDKLRQALRFPARAIGYCLREGNLNLNDIDRIVVSRDSLIDLIQVSDRGKIVSLEEIEGCHHLAHAYGAFYSSSFDRAAVLVVDGDGDVVNGRFEGESGYVFNRDGTWADVFKNRHTSWTTNKGTSLLEGLGNIYDQVSSAIGFASPYAVFAEPGKTMGLAPYGQLISEFQDPWLRVNEDFSVDFTGWKSWVNEKGVGDLLETYDFEKSILKREGELTDFAKNLAFKVQYEYEQVFLELARLLRKKTNCKNVAIGGGCALNSVANGKLVSEGIFEKIFILPACHDGGNSIGAAFWGHMELAKEMSRNCSIKPVKNARFGRSYSDSEIEELLDRTGFEYEKLDGLELAADRAAVGLADSNIIGWFCDRSEVGPRALGGRSILGDPRHAYVKDELNRRVKYREGFRPFAPSVLADRCSDVFEMDAESPYMLRVFPVREAWRDRVPAITHVDGTARIQTVDAQGSPHYHRLISKFNELTGVPLVVNTSFNLKGMPIVESPRDALGCFLFTNLDALYLGRFYMPSQSLVGMNVSLNKNVEAIREDESFTFIVRPNYWLTTRHEFLPESKVSEVFMTEVCRGQAQVPESIEGDIKGMIRLGILSLHCGGERWAIQ